MVRRWHESDDEHVVELNTGQRSNLAAAIGIVTCICAFLVLAAWLLWPLLYVWIDG